MFKHSTGTHLDELLHADHVRLRHGERVLEPVADDDHQRQALPVEVGSRGGLQERGGWGDSAYVVRPLTKSLFSRWCTEVSNHFPAATVVGRLQSLPRTQV